MNVLWGVLTPTGRVAKSHWQTMRFDMRRHSFDSLNKCVEKANAELAEVKYQFKVN